MRFFAAFTAASLWMFSPAKAAPNTLARCFQQPFGQANGMNSPDGNHALWGQYAGSRLWIEDKATHASRPVAFFTVQTISLAWSPDGRHFAVNDRETSGESDAYIFDTNTLQRTRLRDKLAAIFPEVIHYQLTNFPGPYGGEVSHGRDVMHSYLDVLRWIDNEHVELQLHGNFAGRFRHNNPDDHLYPAGCFDLRFRMDLDGSVEKLSKQITVPIQNSNACGWARTNNIVPWADHLERHLINCPCRNARDMLRAMEELFDPPSAAAMRARISSVTATSERQWGKMSAAQMLEHCARGVEMATGDAKLPRIFISRLPGPIIKPMALKDGQRMRPNSPTASALRMTEDTDLEPARAHLLAAYDRFVTGGESQCTTNPHAFFGKLQPADWSKLMHKHLDHHLRQFSV